MNRYAAPGDSGRSLACQIDLAAHRLDRRKVAALEAALSLKSQIRAGLSSPAGLCIAGCAGFLAAEWVHRSDADPYTAHHQQPPPEEPVNNRHTHSVALSNALVLIKIALDLKARWEKANPG